MEPRGVPTACLETKPTPLTVYLRGVPINMSHLSRLQHLDMSYVSRIISGDRDPGRMTVRYGLKIAAALGMGLEDLIDAIYERQAQTREKVARLIIWRQYREAQELREAKLAIARGRVPVPHIPIEDTVGL